MHITSDHYRRRGITRIDDETEAPVSGYRAVPPAAFSASCPLRPSNQTLRRLHRLYLARSTPRHLV